MSDFMEPAHFHDFTDEKMKSHLVKYTAGPHLNQSSISLTRETPI